MKNSSASPVSSASPAPSRAPCSSRTAPASAEARSAPVPVRRTRQKRRISFFRGALTATLLLFAFLFALFPERYVPVCLDGIRLWALNVLPAVFPFLFVVSLLQITGGAEKVSRALLPVSRALFGTGGAGGFCFFMSILSGYPVGATLVAGFYKDGRLSDREAKILACACSTSGPLFIVGSVGAGMFSDKRTGFLILAAHLLAVLLSGVLLRLLSCRRGKRQLRGVSVPHSSQALTLSDGIRNSAITAIGVGGCIAFFYVLAAMAYDFRLLLPLQRAISHIPALAPYADGLSRGLIEMTGGCLSAASISSPLSAPCCAFLVTLGGASILFQQIACLRSANVRIPFFLAVKLFQSAVAFLLCLLFVSL